MDTLDILQCQDIVKKSICESLEIDDVGNKENFFDIGGDSLTALDVIDRMYEFAGVKITISDFMAEPTPVKLAEILHKLDVFKVP